MDVDVDLEAQTIMADMAEMAERSRTRRADLAKRKLCINGEKHGPRTHGPRCAWCAFVWKHGVAKAVKELPVSMYPYPEYKPRPPRIAPYPP